MSKQDSIVTKEESKMINYIRDNHPQTWEWMKDRARSNQMCMSKVFHCYKDKIRNMIGN